MLALRIDKATPRDPSSPLCYGCKHAMRTRDSQGRETLRCRLVGAVRTKIVECSTFYPQNEPWLEEYQSLAWVWSSDDRNEPRFVRLRDLAYGMPGPPSIGFGR